MHLGYPQATGLLPGANEKRVNTFYLRVFAHNNNNSNNNNNNIK